MKTRQIFYISISIFIIIIIAGILIPVIFIHNINGLTEQEINCAEINTHQILENPIERLLILKTVISKKDGNIFTTDSYIFGGLKYATVESECNKQAEVVWRRWFNSSNFVYSQEERKNYFYGNKDKLSEKFDFYVKKTKFMGKDNFCRNWSIDKPIIACGRLIGITAPDEYRDDTQAMSVLRFRGEQMEYDFYFPSNKIDINNYGVGKFYKIDMNNICIYHRVMLDGYHPSRWLKKFIYPEFFDEN